MSYTDSLHQLQAFVTAANRIAIISHENPDGDAIGSSLGLGRVLEKLGKYVSYYIPPKVSKIFDRVPGIKKVKTDFDYGQFDLLFIVDFCVYGRAKHFTEGHEDYFRTRNVVIIDHHEGSAGFASLCIKDTETISCAELIWEIVQTLYPEHIDAQVATYLYLGQTTDSGNFMYEKNSVRAFRNALGMLEAGADKRLIIDNMFNTKTVAALRYEQCILERLATSEHIVWSWYTDADIERFAIEEEEAKHVTDVMQKLKTPPIRLLIHCRKNAYKLHLRSRGVDVARIASELGGGGHKNAAGVTVQIGSQVLWKIIQPDQPSQFVEIVEELAREV